jgi:hypothetical protein
MQIIHNPFVKLKKNAILKNTPWFRKIKKYSLKYDKSVTKKTNLLLFYIKEKYDFFGDSV